MGLTFPHGPPVQCTRAASVFNKLLSTSWSRVPRPEASRLSSLGCCGAAATTASTTVATASKASRASRASRSLAGDAMEALGAGSLGLPGARLGLAKEQPRTSPRYLGWAL